MCSDNMRTLSEINRDIQECEKKLNTIKNEKEFLSYKAILSDLKDEKQLVWDTLFEGHKNVVI